MLNQALDSPDEFNCAIDFTCNHSCPSCRSKIFVPDEQYRKNMNTIVDKLLPYLCKARFVAADGQGDCFASPFVMRFLENVKPQNPEFHMTLETNGVLFDEKHWNRIAHLGKYPLRIVVTPNSFERATYKYLSGGHDDLEKLLRNLTFIKGLREQGQINDFAISIVVQDRNFRELPAFVQRCIDEFCVDSVSVKPIYKWFKLTERDYMSKDILNPFHPYFEEYQDVLEDPRLKHPKVFWWGAKNTHPAKIMYEEKAHQLFEVFSDWLELILDDPGSIKRYLAEHQYQEVGIYGYGNAGKLLRKALKRQNHVIIDRRTLCLEEDVRTVCACEKQFPRMDLLIVTPFYEYDGIYENIRGKTDARIVSLDAFIRECHPDSLSTRIKNQEENHEYGNKNESRDQISN